jgi:hypothetical protein
VSSVCLCVSVSHLFMHVCMDFVHIREVKTSTRAPPLAFQRLLRQQLLMFLLPPPPTIYNRVLEQQQNNDPPTRQGLLCLNQKIPRGILLGLSSLLFQGDQGFQWPNFVMRFAVRLEKKCSERNVGGAATEDSPPHGDPVKALFGKLVVLAAARILRMARLCWRQLAGRAAALSPARRMAVPARRSDAAWTPGGVQGGFPLSQAHAAAVVTEAAAV